MSPDGRGRPRSSRVDEAVLRTARELLAEVGYGGFSVDRLAARAGVGKAAVYRRWSSRAEIVFAAVVSGLHAGPPEDTGSLRDDLERQLTAFAGAVSEPVARRALPGFIADLTDDPALAARFASAVTEPVQARLAAVLDRAVARGELRARPDVPMLHSLLVGPLMAHLLLPFGTEAEGFASRVVAVVVAGLKSQDGALSPSVPETPTSCPSARPGRGGSEPRA
ncbi:MAG TPA: TetR/AcrR family transcriptional regulator [Candidatus Dormibacteraeota bacterium]|nr:TetR/AcrR family transcriptional regulator [Candidatus Dormibacteraeota bacterium]